VEMLASMGLWKETHYTTYGGPRMIVQCAICGFIELVEVAYDWKKGKDRLPTVWICDVHRVEWINRVEE